jgi:hypothetical protein
MKVCSNYKDDFMKDSDLRLKIVVAPDGAHRRLTDSRTTIRLLTKEQISALEQHNFVSYRKKFLSLVVCDGLSSEDWMHGWEEIRATRLVDNSAIRAWDYLRHTISREKVRRDQKEYDKKYGINARMGQ